MSLSALDLSILLPAFAAGLLVTATHVPLGMQVLARGIVFIDLAIAQIAGCGVVLADRLGFEAEGIAVQVAALEPKPGMEPTTSHLAQVLTTLQHEPAKMVVLAAYQGDQASRWLAQRTKINVVVLPFTVGGTPGAKDVFGFYEDTIQRLLKGMS